MDAAMETIATVATADPVMDFDDDGHAERRDGKVYLRNVLIVDAHQIDDPETGAPLVYCGAEYLQKVADNTNDYARRTRSGIPLTLGHTSDDDAPGEAPEMIGQASNFALGQTEDGEPALCADMVFDAEALDRLGIKGPHSVSVEMWCDDRPMIHPIAILPPAITPERPLPVIRLQKGGSRPRRNERECVCDEPDRESRFGNLVGDLRQTLRGRWGLGDSDASFRRAAQHRQAVEQAAQERQQQRQASQPKPVRHSMTEDEWGDGEEDGGDVGILERDDRQDNYEKIQRAIGRGGYAAPEPKATPRSYFEDAPPRQSGGQRYGTIGSGKTPIKREREEDSAMYPNRPALPASPPRPTIWSAASWPS